MLYMPCFFLSAFLTAAQRKILNFFLVMLFLMGAGGEKNKSSEDVSQERVLKGS